MAEFEAQVVFNVRLEEEGSSCLFVVGDCAELGQWKPQQAKPLQLVSALNGSQVWTGSFNIKAAVIRYRFFVGHFEIASKASSEETIIVHAWENMPTPRSLTLLENGGNTVDVSFGRVNGGVFVDRGWLTGQAAVHLSLHSNPLSFSHSSISADKFYIKCLPTDIRIQTNSTLPENLKFAKGLEINGDKSLSGAEIPTKVFVSVLKKEHAKPHLMPHDGVLYQRNDFLTFRVKACHPQYLAFKIVISIEQDQEEISHPKVLKEIGVAYIDPVDLFRNKDSIAITVLSKEQEIVGHLKVDVLVINPLKYEGDMSSSVENFQKPDPQRPWFIGHRGMGRTPYDGLPSNSTCIVGENTVSSLKRATAHGADFVEFDVMLSRDRIPILHHDFVTSISARGRQGNEEKKITIPIQNLSLKELESLQTTASLLTGHLNFDADGTDSEDQPFPLLRNCLEKVDLQAGFNVEVKYCMRLRTGELEEGLLHFPGRNEYVDDILYELLHHGGDRRIFLSSFDPDVCIMLRAKQNRFPVLFLTQGETEKYPQYEDSRTWDVETAFQFAVAESLQGVCVHAENLLKVPSLIERGKKMGLWIICWGDDSNSRENINVLIENGIDGIIVDRIDEFLDR